MEYWKVDWNHEFEVEPVTFYSEIGEDGYEVRKVQRYRDGPLLKADSEHESGEVGLSEIPVGSIEDVAAQAEFSALVISKGDFEAEWNRAEYGSR
ncbi:hypothetical protein ABZ383_18635 [Streptomyces sp. NPDC005900]|uniref:DUF6881 domain-containing protein n=1 Tax=Streptomyces sp. NPDC005900 TaxID=3154569 RepID=UPI0033F684E9